MAGSCQPSSDRPTRPSSVKTRTMVGPRVSVSARISVMRTRLSDADPAETDEVAWDGRDVRDPAETGVLLQLVPKECEDVTLARVAIDRESPQERAADQHGPGAERERADDVAATPDPAVDQEFDPPVDRLGDLRQDLGRG